jgi:hypothetical protein
VSFAISTTSQFAMSCAFRVSADVVMPLRKSSKRASHRSGLISADLSGQGQSPSIEQVGLVQSDMLVWT